MKAYISAIGTANPAHRIPQPVIAEFMADALELQGPERKKLQALYRLSGIEHRHSVLADFGQPNGRYAFFPNTPRLLPFPTVADRMAVYRGHALPVSAEAARNCLEQLPALAPTDITHLITVSCTGMYAPGLDIELIEELGLSPTVQRTCVNFMGCYAAFNALKLADAFCRAAPSARVLIVDTELCTIHFQNRPEDDHLVSNALFGDGAAAVLVQGQPPEGTSLALDAFYCDLATDGKQEMAWHIGDHGFEMTLSSYVPDLIRKGIGQLTQRLLERLQLRLPEISLFAIHPGGTRILKVIEEELQLSREDNRYAYQVLRQFGNMSSATVLFVLRELLAELRKEDAGKRVLSFAFGPGLTLESMLLQVSHV